MPAYELMLIVSPTMEDEDALQTQIESITGRIAQLGGEVSKVDNWGRRRLAYPIRKFNEGDYFLVNMQLPPDQVTTIDRDLKLTEPILRHLIVRTDE